MSLAYPKMRLIIPSLHQGSVNGVDWCGRTSASMIFNYYYAAERGGRGAWWDELIINQRDKDPRDLVFRGPINPGFPVIGGAPIAAHAYDLRGTLNLAKKNGWREKLQLFPQQRREVPSEAGVLEKFAPVTRALDLNNPVLFYSGLSMGIRHIIVISGYWMRGNELWLHIDDPGHRGPPTADQKLPEIRFAKIFTRLPHGVIGDPERQIEQLRPDAAVDGAPGIRYWLHARLLFMDNPNTPVEEDVFGDHGWFGEGTDSPGMTVVCNHDFTDPGGLLEAEVPARYPVMLRQPSSSSDADRAAPLIELWNGVTRAAAPYPLGTNRSWHNGIHIPETNSGVASEDVLPIGAGEVVAARFPRSPSRQASRGIVIVRHAYDPKALRLYPPPSAELPEGHQIVFSLYGNLLGGRKGAKALLEPLDPGPKVEPTRFVPHGAALTLLAPVVGEHGTTLQPLASQRPALGARIAEKKKKKQADEARDYGVLEGELIVTSAPSQLGAADENTWHLLPMAESLRNLGAWETQPEKLGLFDFKKKKEAKDDPMREVLERVEQGHSVLLGVILDGEGWELVDGVVRVREDYEKETLRLHRQVESSGKKRYFRDPTRSFEAFEEIAAVEGLALPCVEAFVGYGNSRRALVEVSYGVRDDEIRDNQVEVDLWNKLNELQSELRRRLVSEVLVDLRTVDVELGITPDAIEKDARLGWRCVTKRPIATMGRLTGKSDLEIGEAETPPADDDSDEPTENRGLHVEIFAAGEILGYEHNRRGWVQVSEQGDDPPGMEAFFRAQLRQLFSINELRSPAMATLGYRDGDDAWNPPNREAWVSFTSRHPRTLSRFVVTHRSEWTLDWDEICGSSNDADCVDVRTSNIPEGDRKPVLPGALKVEGLEGDTFVYYHPLRLVEFLTTGVDLMLTDLAGDEVDPPWITFDDDDGDTISLAGSADQTQGQFRTRLILGDPTSLGTSTNDDGDSASAPEHVRSDVLGLRPATLVLRGLETTQENIPILLRRGEVQQLSFVRPHVNFELTRGGWATSTRAIPVQTGTLDKRHAGQDDTELARHMYMAADDNAKLPNEPVSRGLVVVAARYNLDGPTKAIVELEGNGFSIGEITVSGATGVGHEIPGQTRYEIDLFATRRELPRSAAEVAIVIPVLPETVTDEKATLTVQVEGGDLIAQQECTFTFQTRSLRHGDPPGDDVAKVQLYLSQMLGQGKDATAPKIPHYRAAKGKASIDGDYGDDLARALWRFILTERFHAWPLPEIQTSAGAVPLATISLDFEHHESEVERLVKEKQFPIVDASLLAEIVARYVFPNVLPTLQFGSVTHPAAAGGAWQDVLGKWANWNDVERSTILPHQPAVHDERKGGQPPTPPMELEIRCELTYDPGGDKRGMMAEVTLSDGEVYELAEDIVSLERLLETPIRLAASGVMNAAAKPALRIAGDNGQIWTKRLGGTPDFRVNGMNGFAAAVVQRLMKNEKIKGKPVYAAEVDGDWGTASKEALAAIRKDVDRKTWDDYPALVAHLYGEVLVRLEPKK